MKPIVIIEKSSPIQFEKECEEVCRAGYKIRNTDIHTSKENTNWITYRAVLDYDFDKLHSKETARAEKYKLDLQLICNKISTLNRSHILFLKPKIVNERNKALYKVLDDISNIIAMAMNR